MVSAVLWRDPVRVLNEESVTGLAGVWSAAYAAERACLRVAMAVSTHTSMLWTTVAWNLREAVEELEWAAPQVLHQGVMTDVDSPPRDGERCRQAVLTLVSLASDRALDLLNGQVIIRDAGDEAAWDVAVPREVTDCEICGLTPVEVLAVCRTVQILAKARASLLDPT